MTKKLYVIASIIVAVGALVWLAVGSIGENLVYYWTPTELLQAGAKADNAVIRLGGQVKRGSLQWDKGASDLRFTVSDGTSDVDVHATTIPPQMFREGIGVVVEGRLGTTGIFESKRLLVKHGNEYKPPEGHQVKDLKALMKNVVE